MKRLMKLFLSIFLSVSLLVSTNSCSVDSGGNLANGYILAALINSQTTGTCGISINAAGLWYGNVVKLAVTGGISSTASLNFTSQQRYVFDMEDYNDVTGENVSSGSTNADWGTSFPYNKLYDAFYNFTSSSATVWKNDKVTINSQEQNPVAEALAFARGKALFGAMLGLGVVTCQADAGATDGGTKIQSFYDNLDSNEKEEVTFYIGSAIGASATGGQDSVSLATFTGGFANCGGLTTFDAYYQAFGGGSSATGYTNTASLYYSRAALGTPNATGIFACAQIPKASCSYDSLTTKTRANDITDTSKVFNNLVQQSECTFYDNTNSLWALAGQMFKGLPNNYGSVALRDTYGGSQFSYVNNDANADLYTAGFASNKVLASEAYPKFGTLVDLGFGDLMPVLNQQLNNINSSSTTNPSGYTTFENQRDAKYCCEQYDGSSDKDTYQATRTSNGSNGFAVGTLDTSKPLFSKGVNLKVTPIAGSCSSLGLTYGPYTNAPAPIQENLTSPKEIYYAFSIKGKAAKAYANFADSSTTTTTGGVQSLSYDPLVTYYKPKYEDAIACNKSFRKDTEVPISVGGDRPENLLDELEVPYGDGGATTLISICAYGGDSTARSALKTLLKSALFSAYDTENGSSLNSSISTTYANNNIEDCDSSVSSYAQKFGETGLQNLSAFPDN